MIYNSAKRYDLRYCPTSQQLRTDFESCASVNQSDVIEGNLTSPADPYTMESITLRLPSSQVSTTFYFGIKSVDASGQWSELSNVVPAGVYDLPVEYSIQWITVISFIVLIVLLIIVVSAAMIHRRRSMKANTSNKV